VAFEVLKIAMPSSSHDDPIGNTKWFLAHHQVGQTNMSLIIMRIEEPESGNYIRGQAHVIRK
jgi:hypothetical protein